jgi:hypothetical protein
MLGRNESKVDYSAMNAPTCEACGRQMRLASIEPHHRFAILNSRNFSCPCGATTSDTVARVD